VSPTTTQFDDNILFAQNIDKKLIKLNAVKLTCVESHKDAIVGMHPLLNIILSKRKKSKESGICLIMD